MPAHGVSTPARGMLAVWTNVNPALSADFDAWYTREHVPERVGIPGFTGGRRYEAVRGSPRYLALYDTDTVEVLFSPAYRAKLEHPTPWTQRVTPHFRDTVRAVCRVLSDTGAGAGGWLHSVRLEPLPGAGETLRAALAGPLLGRLLERPGMVRVRALEAVPEERVLPVAAAQGAVSAEGALRGPDQTIHFALLIEATQEAALQAAREAELTASALAKLGAQPAPQSGDYRFLYGLRR